MLDLKDDEWVRSGLDEIEKAISFAVSEMLMLDEIEAQTLYEIQAFVI
ncbi:MAG: hypothetical protein H0A75_02220 [Candidatus Methanofishera endochildressiae]|uniref:Uncharacterized protein n=1 Tax=Candidatus Methanofishera endochildressiae TaxID=2738884 RepID=A0A7Z0SDC5_9GAMM|nr:hypothetical protein [Candidatus Methanofishera endochildressiae]